MGRRANLYLFLALCPLLVTIYVIGVNAIPLKVKDAHALINKGNYAEAANVLNDFMTNYSSTNHFALAYNALAHTHLGQKSYAINLARKSIYYKWRFGSRNQFTLNPAKTPIKCNEIVEKIDLSEEERSFMKANLCK